MCVRAREKEKGSVSTLTSAVQTPHFTASAPLSIAPCSLYAPSLSLYSASARPPPHCVTATAIYSSWATLTTLISLRLPAAFFFFSFLFLLAFSQSVSQPALIYPTGFLTGCQSVPESVTQADCNSDSTSCRPICQSVSVSSSDSYSSGEF